MLRYAGTYREAKIDPGATNRVPSARRDLCTLTAARRYQSRISGMYILKHIFRTPPVNDTSAKPLGGHSGLAPEQIEIRS